MPAPRSKRYESEYLSNYKKFQSRLPNTMKGEVTRSLSYGSNSNGSTPRAGLQSSQLGTIHEPPLQRKRMVPYEKNHNIFTTVTVKEQPDREWLKTDGESYRSRSPPADRRHKEEKSKRDAVINRSETPILAAERKIFKEQPRNINRTVYIPDRIKRRSTYKGDFVDYKGKSKTSNSAKQKSKPKRQQSPHKVVGGNKGEVSPDRLPPAGIRSVTSIGDARLLKPSDDSQYMRSPEREQKVFNTEYTSRYAQPVKFKYVNGLWLETPVNAGATHDVKENKKKTPDWFTQALDRRNEAYGYSQHARGTHFSRESLDEMNREQAKRASSRSESQRSYSPAEERSRGKEVKPRYRTRSSSPPRRREAWAEVRARSPRESDDRRVEANSDDDAMVLERGRSPTPELRDTRISRRHHLDVTTNILNDSFEKSLSISDQRKPRSRGSRDDYAPPPKEERQLRPASPSSSIGLGDDARSYTPPRKVQERSPPEPPGASPVATLEGRERRRDDDDVLSVSAMSSRASTASETLERARKRRDEFWKRENASK